MHLLLMGGGVTSSGIRHSSGPAALIHDGVINRTKWGGEELTELNGRGRSLHTFTMSEYSFSVVKELCCGRMVTSSV